MKRFLFYAHVAVPVLFAIAAVVFFVLAAVYMEPGVDADGRGLTSDFASRCGALGAIMIALAVVNAFICGMAWDGKAPTKATGPKLPREMRKQLKQREIQLEFDRQTEILERDAGINQDR